LKLETDSDFRVFDDDIGSGGTAVIKRGELLHYDLIKKSKCQEIAVKYYKKDGSEEETSFLYEVALS
jgi:hypothetical protein